MANHDRVGDLYHRRIHSTEAQNACRERIHWLCTHVDGDQILDIGCSQGVVALILGREGRTVLGLDIEAAAIESAQQALREESEPVQQRVAFRVADVFAENLEPNSFDTVIVGEVLEHLATPDRLLERIRDWLSPGGRLVLSVPHGYEPHDDHKRTFFLSRLADLLSQSFEIETIEAVHGMYLCAVAICPSDGQTPQPPTAERMLAWLQACEAGIETMQARKHHELMALRADRKQVGERLATFREHNDKLKLVNDELREQIRSVKAERDKDRDRFQQNLERVTGEQQAVTEKLTALTRKHEESSAQANQLKAQVQSKTDALNVAQQELASAKHEIEELRQQHQQALNDLKHQSTQRQSLDKNVRELEQQRKSWEQQRRKLQQTAGQVERLRGQVEHYHAELALRGEEVRYQLGDAVVRACRPSMDTLKLPYRIIKLAFVGLGRVRQRRLEAQQRKTAAAPSRPKPTEPAKAAAAPAPPAIAAPSAKTNAGSASSSSGFELNSISTLAEPFSSTPPALRRRNDLCVAAVTDEFSWRAWQYEAELYTFTPKTWREALEARKPDLLLIESAWSGLEDSWYFQIRDLCQRGDVIKYYAIPDVIRWCRSHDIPTVFYNKEDPPNFDVFVEAAKQFDVVFTSDANCIDEYRKHAGHDRIFALPFAAQPRIHNPIMTGTRTGSVCFAGTWYNHRHFNRHEDAENVLRPALDFDLNIFDRMANSGNENYRWPDEFLTAVRGALPYSQMLAAYKRYKVFLNINSVRNSPTMFARRVFELLACGTPVISSYSTGIEEQLGADLVLMSEDEKTTREHLERLLGDDQYRDRLALRGQRKVFCEHTYTNRMDAILNAAGIARPAAGKPRITMIAAVTNADELAAAYATYSQQTYENKQLLICANDAKAVAAADRVTGAAKDVHVVVQDGALWGRVFRDALRDLQSDYVAALHPGHFYGPYYLTDYANASLYNPEPAIGKAAYYALKDQETPQLIARDKEYRVVSAVAPWTLCLPHDAALESAAKLGGAQTAHEWWNRAMRGLNRIYSADRFNYVEHAAGAAARLASRTATAGLQPAPALPTADVLA